jgi:peroxiredoxin
LVAAALEAALRLIVAGSLTLFACLTATAAEPLQPASGPKPGFVLRDLSGADVKLEAQRGHIVLVHFFATWCEPCREELPALRRLVERSTGTPVAVLAISVGEVGARVRRFMQTMPINFPILLDSERAVAKSWDVYALPTTFVLDAALTPRLVSNGEFAWDRTTVDELRAMIATTPRQRTGITDQTRTRGTQQGG